MTPQVTLPSLSSRLYKRFLEAEVDFFCAFTAGDDAMEGFSRSWSILTRDFQSALLTTVLETKLLEVAHAVSSTIANFGYGMEDIRVHSETSTELVIDELTLVLSDMSLNDRSICRFNCDPDNPLLCHWPCLPDSSPRSSRRYRLPPYIPSAFSWLLDNIHNPYPSNIVKKSLAQVAHSTPRRIGDWFKDMRQYIGWGAVCNSHFGGSRAAMVRAARRALVHDGVVGPVHNEGVLISIRDTVESLYVPERCAAFITATSTTPNQPTRPPRLSPTPSLASCHSDDSDNDEVIPELDPPHPAHETVLPAVFESQRDLMDPEFFNQPHRSLSSLCNLVNDPISTPPRKPIHLAHSTRSNVPHDISCRESNIQNSTPSVRPSRKRRLSNSDSHLTAKRPRRSPVGPRAQAVSDPLLAIPDIFPAFSRPEELEASFEMSTCQVTMTPPNSLDSLSLFNNWEALAPAESADFDIFSEFLAKDAPYLESNIGTFTTLDSIVPHPLKLERSPTSFQLSEVSLASSNSQFASNSLIPETSIGNLFLPNLVAGSSSPKIITTEDTRLGGEDAPETPEFESLLDSFSGSTLTMSSDLHRVQLDHAYK